jgi:hypothetical protein
LFAAELAVGVHHARCHGVLVRRQTIARASGEIDGANIQRRADADARAAGNEFFRKQRSGIAVIQRAVDVRGLDWQQPIGGHQPRRLGDDAHGHGGALAARAARDRALV